MTDTLANHFHFFHQDMSSVPLPDKFTFPFYYSPHPLCAQAALELQNYLQTHFKEEHNFGLVEGQKGMVIGKMFGILIVRTMNNDIGHLWAFSGKLADKNIIPHFVPPVYDTLAPGEHYKKMESVLNEYNDRISKLESDPEYRENLMKLEQAYIRKDDDIRNLKASIQSNKISRDAMRMSCTDEQVILSLSEESKREQIKLKYLKKHWQQTIEELDSQKKKWESKIMELKEKRKKLSNETQQFIFDQYNFLNALGESVNVLDIFRGKSALPPSGSGECAMPKLLQYAYQHQLQPIAMCEFWWGQSPPSEVRKHKQFYPSCRSKCEPILDHMLKGINVHPNPMMETRDLSHDIRIIYEDNYLLIVNKPTEMLSVPGKNPDAVSLYDVIRAKYPVATGPLLVHRLDMSTSGIVLIAKTKEIHENLQSQFIKRTVKKRYAALLDGIIASKKGRIELPIRVDLDNRPRQLVCYDYGKMSVTDYEVIRITGCKTKIHYYPITGRTHQLRVHSAHHLGLNCPIAGDDLYGRLSDRLYLHANLLQFRHPVTRKTLTVECPEEF